ncbi:hypothetical protein QSI13_24780, partial [Escherichia coli]|uniref:hypothetical protein n=1 Tax=Escherichia coli TaxID=562 RepID=UPI00256F164F
PAMGRMLPKVAEEVAPPFYSAMQRAIQSAKLEKGTPEQWTGYLRNQPSVKAEELSTLGQLPEGLLTKDQI